MANTTNFGWETPDDTDLVKDGAAAIRTVAGAIDTSLVDLKGGTSGQVLSKNSNTDMDFVWVTSDDANAIQNAIVDAKGDLISATAADTPARLAVGANDTVLTADSSTATGLKWATPAGGGGYTLLSTTTLSGTSTSISITPTGYKALMIDIQGVDLSGTDGVSININNDSKTNMALVRADGTPTASVYRGQQSYFNYNNGDDMSGTTHVNCGVLWIYNPTSTTVSKAIDFRVSWLNSASQWCSYFGGGGYTGSSISSINFDQFGSTTFDGGSVLVYGVK